MRLALVAERWSSVGCSCRLGTASCAADHLWYNPGHIAGRKSVLSKRRGKGRSGSERILWILSLFLVASMVISLVIVALPSAPAPTPTPYPTFTPIPHPTATSSPIPTATLPAATATAPAVGPLLPTATPSLTPTLTVLPSPTATMTEPAAGPVLLAESVTVTPALSLLPAPTVSSGDPDAGPALPVATGAPTSPAVAPRAVVSPSLVFAVCGDSRDNPEVYQRILDAVSADGSQFLVHAGDLVSEDDAGLWQEFQATMGNFAKAFYPVPGNHDTLHGDLQNYLQYSGAPAAHYSFDVATVHMTLADSHDGGISAAELDWLRNDLGATSQPVKMVFLHHPAFDPDGTDHIMAYGNEQFMALMTEAGVDYVIAGHIHAYARDDRDGVVYIYTGGGGAPLYSADHPQAFYHYLRITVTGEETNVEVVRVS
jgi:predicted phosphodiesterase